MVWASVLSPAPVGCVEASRGVATERQQLRLELGAARLGGREFCGEKLLLSPVELVWERGQAILQPLGDWRGV